MNNEQAPTAPPSETVTPPVGQPMDQQSHPVAHDQNHHLFRHDQGTSPAPSQNSAVTQDYSNSNSNAMVTPRNQDLDKHHHHVNGNLMALPMTPVTAYCKHCQRNQITRVEDHVGCDTWWSIGCLSILCACMPCCFAPCCMSTCKTQVHRCSQCNHKIGKSKPGLFGRKH